MFQLAALLIIIVLLPVALIIIIVLLLVVFRTTLPVLEAIGPFLIKAAGVLLVLALVLAGVVWYEAEREEERAERAKFVAAGSCKKGTFIYNCSDASTPEAACELIRREENRLIAEYKLGEAARRRSNDQLVESGCGTL
ncbi:MAG: hypothetical protein ACLPX9_05450 [Rhodomicrobium sp.]